MSNTGLQGFDSKHVARSSGSRDRESEPDQRRRCKLSSHISSGIGSHKQRPRDSRRCIRRRDLTLQQHVNDVLPRVQHMADRGRANHVPYERLTLFSDLAALDSQAVRRGPVNVLNKHEPSELESRFWAEGSGEGRTRASCSSSRQGECREVKVLGDGECGADFSSLPFDVIRRIAGSFSWPNLWATSRVCRAWSEALHPLREAMLLVHWGKKLKHGRGGVSRNLEKALDSFLKGAVRGCAAAMVDAGLLLWEMGRREEGIQWYKQAAELGDPAGQCNLGLAYLQESGGALKAAKWFHQAALAGHVRAQYSLALCLQQGRGVERNLSKAARWYLRAATGGSSRAMYNTALCFLGGEGLLRDYQEARRWMRRAALAGHRKAQFEHGLTLFAEGDGGLALVFLELATRAGETSATHTRDVLLQQLSPKMRAHAIACADNWQGKQMRHS